MGDSGTFNSACHRDGKKKKVASSPKEYGAE